MPNASGVVNAYLTAFTAGEFEAARAVVAEDFSFQGPFITTTSREEYFAGAAGLRAIVRGHRMLRQWEDGDEVCSVYELQLKTPAAAGAVLMAEWHTVRAGQLASSRLVFDTAAFRAIVPPARPSPSSA
jgi:predicted SnoaL-like aldol condensation-catalyzing enzyme